MRRGPSRGLLLLVNLRTASRAAYVYARSGWRAVRRAAGTEATRLVSRRGRADLAVFHEFAPPPSGGGNQFLAGLVESSAVAGSTSEVNRISGETPACLFNSFNFDDRRLRRFVRAAVAWCTGRRADRRLPRLDDGTDGHIADLNACTRTRRSSVALQPREAQGAGLELRDPVVIPNAPDRAVFNAARPRDARRRTALRLITTSWSDNPRKVADVIADRAPARPNPR